ncbi:hypothetical protein BSZ37_05605 [Rubrivirga marina]|uniref:Sulfotransferase domain-containing protein n=1 Tax=Rubrivirga marina TaxID=1196024 RepID=A0A271IXG7_9BACT|nr:hypothetical protein BSZ37_05605 [Rubrivirga marina]
MIRHKKRPYMLINGVRMVHTGVVHDRTRIVIEGYPRCGNTFATVAFQLAQGTPVEAAHHLHAEAQIVGAAAAGIPTILLIRDPEEAVVSNARSFGYPLKTALRDYVLFYRRVLPYREHVVVADFQDVTSDFGAVVGAVNARFGTDFAPFDHTDAEVQRCFAVIDEFYRRTAPEPGRTVARPSGQRQVGKDVLRTAFNLPSHRALRDEAYRLYHALVQAPASLSVASRGDGAAGRVAWAMTRRSPPRGSAAPGHRTAPPHPDQ